MRILLTVLLFLFAIATTVATIPILSLPNVSLALKIPPFIFVLCSVVSAILVIRRHKSAFLTYIVGFVVLPAANILADGFSAVPKAGMGFIVSIKRAVIQASTRSGRRYQILLICAILPQTGRGRKRSPNWDWQAVKTMLHTMNRQIQISAKNLGALALPAFCPRCFWIRMKCGGKLPYQIFPGIFSSIQFI